MKEHALVLTLGYEKRSLAECVELLRSAAVQVVLDVRQTAWSHKPGFSKSTLSRGLESAGIAYVHIPLVGNPKELRRAATSHAHCLELYEAHLNKHPTMEAAFDEVITSYLESDLRVCLLCFERHPSDCHRGILARRWAERAGGRTEDIAPNGCARLL